MFSHLIIGSNDIDRAQAFYDGLLAVIGAEKGARQTNATGQQRVFYMHKGCLFGITQPIDGQPATVANGGTIGFQCNSPEQVRRFHDTAVALGGTSIESPPGVRQGPAGALYQAYVRDPDGHKLCALYRMKPGESA